MGGVLFWASMSICRGSRGPLHLLPNHASKSSQRVHEVGSAAESVNPPTQRYSKRRGVGKASQRVSFVSIPDKPKWRVLLTQKHCAKSKSGSIPISKTRSWTPLHQGKPPGIIIQDLLSASQAFVWSRDTKGNRPPD